MTEQTDSLRGHPIELSEGEWCYVDNGKATANNRRDCGHCGQADTAEEYDGCIGRVYNAMNACCGHGDEASIYVQFPNGITLRGRDAQVYINHHQTGELSQ